VMMYIILTSPLAEMFQRVWFQKHVLVTQPRHFVNE
jgi:hypothetical protein